MQGRRHMSTPLLPEVVPEIDANPVSFYSGGGGWGITITWGLGSLQNTENAAYLVFPLGTKAQRFSASGGFAPELPDQGLCPWTLGASHQTPYRLALCEIAMCVHPTFFDLATPLGTRQSCIYALSLIHI